MAMNEVSDQTGYVLGHSGRELERLEQQATFFGDMTRDVLVKAGLGKGMKVLDLGCGVGDVSMIAADLVGPDGAVTGIDISADALGIATARAAATGRANATFTQSAIDDFAGFDNFDAVVGRFIMVHIPDPAAMLGRLKAAVKPGTIIGFCEMDLGTVAAVPATPLLNTSLDWIAEVYRRAGLDPNAGTKLFQSLRAAGLAPSMFGYTRIGDRTDLAGLAFLAESVRSLLPLIGKLGIATPDSVGIETLRDRLVAEAEAADPCIFYPRFIGGWTRA